MIFKKKSTIRKKIFGFLEKPRVSIFRSNKHIYAQVIDDYKGNTLISASSKKLLKFYKKRREKKITKKELSYKIGNLLGKIIKSYGISKILFDRNGYIYHGRVKALAKGLRNVGLQF
ncbi:50S ribosomal protein L18 [Candidatus Karelsulcia muelleri]|uniref:50S ribosomal protein L18 n=1 Tax=Candidatus Karelsulcia muelleri TaxID=336810 RepID=UPI0035C91BC3